MNAAAALIFLSVVVCLTAAGLNQQIVNEKINAAAQARIIAFNSAEAGLVAQQAKINGEIVSLADIPGELHFSISSDIVDNCQQHTLTLISTAIYQNARVKLSAAYLKVPAVPAPGCPTQISHRLWWRELDFE